MAVLGPQNTQNPPIWFTPIGILSFSVSLAVNAIFTGLLVFKIAKASLALRHAHATGIQDFSSLISMLIESGLVLFIVQLVWIICFKFRTESNAFNVTSGAIAMIYVRRACHIYLFFLLMCFKGNYTDNYYGACRSGRCRKYGR